MQITTCSYATQFQAYMTLCSYTAQNCASLCVPYQCNISNDYFSSETFCKSITCAELPHPVSEAPT